MCKRYFGPGDGGLSRCSGGSGIVIVTVRGRWRGESRVNGNGLPDVWETQCFGGTIDPTADADGDGLSNLQEQLAGAMIEAEVRTNTGRIEGMVKTAKG